jgi:membrane-associated phospholipid phosphatase
VPYVWATAAAFPLVTGILRLTAGKHYPSDVLVGYLVGAATGILVPFAHQRMQHRRSL